MNSCGGKFGGGCGDSRGLRGKEVPCEIGNMLILKDRPKCSNPTLSAIYAFRPGLPEFEKPYKTRRIRKTLSASDRTNSSTDTHFGGSCRIQKLTTPKMLTEVAQACSARGHDRERTWESLRRSWPFSADRSTEIIRLAIHMLGFQTFGTSPRRPPQNPPPVAGSKSPTWQWRDAVMITRFDGPWQGARRIL